MRKIKTNQKSNIVKTLVLDGSTNGDLDLLDASKRLCRLSVQGVPIVS